jgi:LPS-assembly lipoprotein
VLGASAVAPVSYDTPGEQQRFARSRGLRDAENRAAQQIAETIRSRLASFFVAGS